MSEVPFHLFAPAKVNLALAVTGRRSDGYHLLDSTVVFAGIGDTLTFDPAGTLSLVIDGPKQRALNRLPDNIVLKAARLLAEEAGVRAGATIRLTKRLPVASGIGGGSTDAATALKGLCRLWGLSLGAEDLAALGLRLGADVPVCLAARPARMQGVGEIISPLPALPRAWLVLVNPGMGLSTPAVFKTRTGPFSESRPLLAQPPADARALAEALAEGGNDLTEAAVTLAPVVGTVISSIAAMPGCLLARMSGSGATCFGLFAAEPEARSAAAMLKREHSAWWAAPGPIL